MPAPAAPPPAPHPTLRPLAAGLAFAFAFAAPADPAFAPEAVGGRSPSAVPPPPIHAAMTPAALGAALDPYLEALAADDAFSGIVLLAREGVPVYTRALGLADRAHGIPIGPETRFNLASIGKIFTRVAVGQLVAAGRLSLDDRIAEHLPDYPNREAAATVTVEHLLEHQAGIPDILRQLGSTSPGKIRSNSDWAALVAGLPLEFAPGTSRRYCNGCYAVLGEIMAAASGLPYEDYVARHVFAPARMAGAGFFASDEPLPHVAESYTRRPAPGQTTPLRSSVLGRGARGSAAGGSYATAADLLAFEEALREHRLLDRERTAWIYEDSPLEPPATRSRGAIGIAGGSPGTNAVLEADGTWTVIVLTNLDPPVGEDLGLAIAKALRR